MQRVINLSHVVQITVPDNCHLFKELGNQYYYAEVVTHVEPCDVKVQFELSEVRALDDALVSVDIRILQLAKG